MLPPVLCAVAKARELSSLPSKENENEEDELVNDDSELLNDVLGSWVVTAYLVVKGSFQIEIPSTAFMDV